MAAVTIDNVITGAQDRSDKVNDPSVATAVWLLYANAAIEEMWQVIAAANATYWDTFGDVTVASAASPFIDLSAAPFTADPQSGGWIMRKLRLVEKDPLNNVPVTVVKRTLATKDMQRYPRGYLLAGKKLYLDPPNVAPGNYRIYYAAGPAVLAAAATLPVEIIPFREYLEVGTAMRALAAEESDVQVLAGQLADLRARLVSTVAAQDDATADRIQDTLANDEIQRWGAWYPLGML